MEASTYQELELKYKDARLQEAKRSAEVGVMRIRA